MNSPRRTSSYDAIVIGSGQAGPSLAARLVDAGKRVALVERRRLGGTCVNDGCMPTKTLVASARAAHIARRAADFGVRIDGTVSVDMKAVKARKDAVVGQSVANLTKWLGGTNGLRLVHGHARFVGPHAMAVENRPVDGAWGEEAADGEVLEAPHIFVNTGGRALLPDWPGIADVTALTNSSVMDLDVLPRHLVIAGGSYIGLEFAQVYRRFGAEVTVVEFAPRLIAREDEHVSRAVQSMLAGEGVRFVLGARDTRLARSSGGAGFVLDTVDGEGRSHHVEGSHLLAAVGRRANTDDLGLDAAGIATDARGFITVDDQLRTNVDGVWALGDANGRGAFTHTSYNDYEIVAANLLQGESRRVGDRIACYALFTDPPLARIGMTRAQVLQTGRAALIGTMPMTRVGRARERGETQGFMEVIVDAESQHILGAALLCIEGDEVVHSLLDVMAAGASVDVIRRTRAHSSDGERIDPDAACRLAAARGGSGMTRTRDVIA